MARHRIPESLRGIVRLRTQRVFRLHYQCEACPNEWSDESLVVTHGYCPCCDARIEEPYYVEPFCEERPEFDLDLDEGKD